MTHRWFTETEAGHSERYAEHFRRMTAEGGDTEGEARLMDALVPPHSVIVDAGCGQGRTAGALVARGHRVVGVDVDPILIDAARRDHPGPEYVCADLATLDLTDPGGGRWLFDAAVSAGNVITYGEPDSEVAMLASIRRHLRPDAPLVLGFHTARYSVEECDHHAREAGFLVESRFSTWDLRPWHPTADFAVTILRNPVH